MDRVLPWRAVALEAAEDDANTNARLRTTRSTLARSFYGLFAAICWIIMSPVGDLVSVHIYGQITIPPAVSTADAL